MRVSIVRRDGAVTVDGETYKEIDTSSLPEEVHAIQWYDNVGEIEIIDPTITHKIVMVRNDEFTDFTPYQHFIDKWQVKKDEWLAFLAEHEKKIQSS